MKDPHEYFVFKWEKIHDWSLGRKTRILFTANETGNETEMIWDILNQQICIETKS